jgi:hypothetical protein
MGILAAPEARRRGAATDYDSLRKANFVHMWVTHWESRYKLREMPAAELRYLAAKELFNSADGYQYWTAVRRARLELQRGRLTQFNRIVDDEYRKVIPNGSPAAILGKTSDEAAACSARQRPHMESMTLTFAAIGTAFIAGRILGRHRSRKT